MGQAVPESDLPGSLVSESQLPGAVDNTQYANSPISTFAANAVNGLTFGLPEYLNRTFTPEAAAEGQRYQAANPMAANLGTATGQVAGIALPAGYGAVKGAQLGIRGAEALMSKLPNLGRYADLANLYGKSQGAITGASMGAQAGSALPGVVQGNPGQAVAAPALVNEYANKLPMINHLGGLTGNVVPAAAGGAATAMQSLQDQFRLMMQYKAAKKVLGQP